MIIRLSVDDLINRMLRQYNMLVGQRNALILAGNNTDEIDVEIYCAINFIDTLRQYEAQAPNESRMVVIEINTDAEEAINQEPTPRQSVPNFPCNDKRNPRTQ
jgi:hypothetical protein